MNKTTKPVTSILFLTLFVLSWIGSVQAIAPKHLTIENYRELRYQGVVAQSDWFTCGPAATATLLTHYFEIATTEEEMVASALFAEFGTRSSDEAHLKGGFSLLSLREAMSEKGIASQGFRLSVNALIDYYQRGGLPLIIHVTQPQLHFVVGVGIAGSEIVLADPSLGLHAISFESLVHDKGFSGMVLVPMPPTSLSNIAGTRQRSVLQRFEDRYAQLASLGRRL